MIRSIKYRLEAARDVAARGNARKAALYVGFAYARLLEVERLLERRRQDVRESILETCQDLRLPEPEGI